VLTSRSQAKIRLDLEWTQKFANVEEKQSQLSLEQESRLDDIFNFQIKRGQVDEELTPGIKMWKGGLQSPTI
jgi:hypothetical protein